MVGSGTIECRIYIDQASTVKKQWVLGHNQFVPFIVTVGAILFTNLLVGISIGMAVGFNYIPRANYTPLFFRYPRIHMIIMEYTSANRFLF